MDIGIIGSGNIGSTLARHLTALGHQVLVANSRGPASLAAVTAETGATAATVERVDLLDHRFGYGALRRTRRSRPEVVSNQILWHDFSFLL